LSTVPVSTSASILDKVGDVLSDGKDKLEEAAKKATKKAEEAARKVRDKAKKVAKKAEEAARKVRDKAKKVAKRAKEKAKKIENEIKDGFEDVKDGANSLREDLLDKPADKVTKEIERFDDRIDRLREKVKKARKSFSKGVNSANKAMARVYDAPREINNPSVIVDNADIEFSVSSEYIQDLVSNLFREKYPLGEMVNIEKDYIVMHKPRVYMSGELSKADNNIIYVSFDGKVGVHEVNKYIDGDRDFYNALIALEPKLIDIADKNGVKHRYLQFYAVLNWITLKKTSSNYIDFIARSFIDEAIGKKPLFSLKVEDIMKESIAFQVLGNDVQLKREVSDIGYYIDKNTLNIQVKLDNKKGDK